MKKWEKETLPLGANHGWKSKPGYSVFVADHGAVLFQTPNDWMIEPKETSVQFHDAKPPDDNCRLEMTVFHLPDIDWSAVPLAKQFADANSDSDLEVIRDYEMLQIQSPERELEIVWRETVHIDRTFQRKASSRMALARGRCVQVLLTMDFWASDVKQFDPVWQTVLDTLELGVKITDPMLGPQLQ